MHLHRLFLAVVAGTCLVLLYSYLRARPPHGFYRHLHDSEIEASTRYENSPTPVRYLYFPPTRAPPTDFATQLQNVLLLHNLAVMADRTFVHQPFAWAGREQGIPLSAFLLGVTRNSIAESHFNLSCPAEHISHFTLDTRRTGVQALTQFTLQAPDDCLVVSDLEIDESLYATESIDTAFLDFVAYLSSDFLWSLPIQHLIARTFVALNLRSPSRPAGDRFLAVQLPTAEFSSHCTSLATSGAGLSMWNSLDAISLFPPLLNSRHHSSVMEHCAPSLSRILEAVQHALTRTASRHIRTVHFIYATQVVGIYPDVWKIEEALKHLGLIDRATHTGQIPLGWGEADFTTSVDIEIATRAEAFLGLGYSNLSSYVIAARTASGRPLESILLL